MFAVIFFFLALKNSELCHKASCSEGSGIARGTIYEMQILMLQKRKKKKEAAAAQGQHLDKHLE